MYLTGFGHGVSFGAQAVGTSTYLWTEVEANGYGRRLARFKFTNGTTLPNTSSGLTKFTPVAAATEHTCSIDPVNDRLIVRYHENSAKHIAVYDHTAATNGNFTSPLATFAQPDLGTRKFQGYAAYGSYLYLLTGHSYDENGNVGDSEITSVNMNTGAISQGPVLTNAGSTLGFASGAAGDWRSNLFYKNVLV